MQRGVAYGVIAGALWGMVFLVPRVLPDFSPLLLCAGRYTMYGVVSLAAALPVARSLVKRLTREDLVALVKLALAGNLLYYLLLTAAVHLVGIAPASLIVGVLPVTVTLMGRGDRGAVPLARLAWPLAMVMAGIGCINIDVFTAAEAASAGVATRLVGLACAVGALGCWTWFAVENTRYLQRQTHFSGNEWSVLWGVVTGMLGAALWLVTVALPPGSPQGELAASRWHSFWLLNLGLAIGASWLGNSLWNAASKRLPLTLSGQLIVFETLFALLYAFIYDARLPRPLEIAAILLLVGGVCWSVRQHADDDSGGTAQIGEKAQGSAP
ncbi:DMT family transporter [bacterium M00.F.Ca.ET.228.01.1.1]|uniref:DMT family transporter n=1 Tax=Paraburkholderia phenoliruptrix TaxID=252970 RepID=UPI001092A914|nr:DMT family transporter [Paraburkholderia phenoliruptrix]TGP41814.1 DMT family transporter [bacterium M00.F.Ca.ET.228.01.1.1]TGR98605.1 DMT family transporter [bacterium M00.F.Ca.ET.191.01.1.1]TGU02940.1 DMT family transporter [bacterium M00.F.Ca.ET.155.01.1.1]MBW0447803.1 DMT family transporter [Paraburkholderia phenoliruptrix]MBW9098415.1 DMT family transporter [Paraburkholderia phenoliruptrix]